MTEGGNTLSDVIDPLNPSGYARVIEERASGVLVARYVYGAGLDPIAMDRGGVPSLYLDGGHCRSVVAIELEEHG